LEEINSNEKINKIKENMAKGNFGGYILEEAYQSVYFIHPKGTKMYRDFKQMFRWTNMKRDTTIM